ncbi:hypothetical protein KP79_PYT08129 [Mizuhopecten yessoensis]|uniref:Uncharacterized protein n=1 Tax=Mizuhopecten yessoensis TaxID=6573 RepID=A0A210QBU3_MIZYE|nr:hypothetical protein KP79_PYT08129 [Mizuhopecten yessoensis]
MAHTYYQNVLFCSGEASRNVILPEETTIPPADDSGDSSWGVIVPVILLGLFVVSFIIFLCRHCIRRKRRRSPSDSTATSLGRFSRSLVGSSTTGISYIHSTTRSTTHLSSNLRVDQAFVMPMAPQYMFYCENGIWKLCTNSVDNTRGHLNPLSAMDEVDSSFMSEDVYMDVSKIDDVSAQTPFTQNPTTWATPQAPPPSYEESEAGSPDKRFRLMLVNTTNSEDTYSTCQTFDKDAFHVHNNTPATDGEYSASSMSCPQIQNAAASGAVPSEALMNTNLTISHMTSYPSTLLSSTDASLSTSSLDTWEEDDTSFVTSYHDSSYSISRRRGNNASTAHGSQQESESSGVPSLPSSILYFHQKMAGNSNAGLIECQSRRLSYPYNYSIANTKSWVESDYMEHTCSSMIPNVGDDSRNPCMSTPIPHSNARGLLEQGIRSQACFSRCDMSPLRGGHNRNLVEPIASGSVLDVNQFSTPTRVGTAYWV